MREYINAFRTIVRRRNLLFKRLWRSYLAMILTAMGATVALMNILPAYIVSQHSSQNEANVLNSAGLSYVELLGAGISVVLFIVASVWAHRKTVQLLHDKECRETWKLLPPRPWSRTKKASMLTLSIILLSSALAVIVLPLSISLLSIYAAASSATPWNDVVVPAWGFLLTALFSGLGVCLMLFILLFLRLTFLQKQSSL